MLRKRRMLAAFATWALCPTSCPPSAAFSQTLRRVAVLVPSRLQWQERVFREALAALGYVDGTSVRIEVVSADGNLDRLPRLAEELVAASPQVIVAVNGPGTHAAARATSRIPIVSAAVADPVLLGIVKNIARPEANVTGIANMASDITSKRVGLLKEAVPSARHIALLLHPDEPIVEPQLRDIASSAASLGIEYRTFRVRTSAELRQALEAAKAWGAQGVVRLAGQGLELGPLTARLALELRLPSMLLARADVEAGGLMSYFADQTELWRRVAAYVARILEGASPASLPFELPSRFEFVVNLSTARELDVTLPPILLARADLAIQ